MDTSFNRARRLRRDMSPPEHAVWAVIRGRGLGGWKFRRQVPIGPYIVDFVCPEKRLVLEIDGPSHDAQLGYDLKRDRYLRDQGYRVMRLTNEQVLQELEGAMHVVLDALHSPVDPLT